MFVPSGYLNFFEVAEEVRQLARDLSWSVRTKPVEGGFQVIQVPGERDAIECWLLCQFSANVGLWVASPEGTVLRAPQLLCRHADQIELSPCPVPIEESSLVLPAFSNGFEPGQYRFFRDRFLYLNWQVGQVEISKKEDVTPDFSAFSEEASSYLCEQRRAEQNAVVSYEGWNICVDESEFDCAEGDLLEKFGVDEGLLEGLNAGSHAPLRPRAAAERGRPRIRDEALKLYEQAYPQGHEVDGISLKEATNVISSELGRPISVDTLRRALGKKV